MTDVPDHAEVLRASEKLYDDLTDVQREKLQQEVRRACLSFAETVEEWIPGSLSGNPGESLNVTFKILWTKIG